MPIPPSIIPSKRRVRRRRHQAAAASPPPPPPAPVGVLRVMASPGEPMNATWVFEREIDAPTGSIAGLLVNGSPGLAWVWDDPQALRVDYAIVIAPGQSWSNAAGAAGIVATDGGMLDAGSGTVEAG